MKFIPILLLIHVLFSLMFSSAYAEHVIKFDTPPTVLEKWYKPGNKRQV